MPRATRIPGGMIAGTGAALLVSGAVVFLSATLVGEHIVSMQQAHAEGTSTETALIVNRSGKGDKLPAPEGQHARAEIKSVEVIGIANASIVYRDRDGNILYQTDPLANVTIVTKNVELPEVTIRESETVEVERMPAEEARPSAQPHGCESAFARPSPESLTRMSSRCVTDLSRDSRKFAAN